MARKFEVMPECSVLPPDCFSCIIRTARDMGVPKDILEAGVQRFCTDRLPSSRSEESKADVTTLTPAEFEEVCVCVSVCLCLCLGTLQLLFVLTFLFVRLCPHPGKHTRRSMRLFYFNCWTVSSHPTSWITSESSVCAWHCTR